MRAAEIEGTAVFRIVVSSDSIKKATATSHGNRRLLVGESDGVMAASGAFIKKLGISPGKVPRRLKPQLLWVVIDGPKCLRENHRPSSVPQGRLNLAQDDSPGNMSSNSASPAGTAETTGNGFTRPCGTRHLSLPNPGLRPGLSSGVPAGLSSERWFSCRFRRPSPSKTGLDSEELRVPRHRYCAT